MHVYICMYCVCICVHVNICMLIPVCPDVCTLCLCIGFVLCVCMCVHKLVWTYVAHRRWSPCKSAPGFLSGCGDWDERWAALSESTPALVVYEGGPAARQGCRGRLPWAFGSGMLNQVDSLLLSHSGKGKWGRQQSHLCSVCLSFLPPGLLF